MAGGEDRAAQAVMIPGYIAIGLVVLAFAGVIVILVWANRANNRDHELLERLQMTVWKCRKESAQTRAHWALSDDVKWRRR